MLELESLLDEILSNQCSQWPLAQQRKLFSVLLDELKHEENVSGATVLAHVLAVAGREHCVGPCHARVAVCGRA